MHLHAFDLVGDNPFGEPQSTQAQEEYRKKTFDELERLNIIGVSSGPAHIVRKWKGILPERIIPGLLFWQPDEVNIDSLRAFFQRGDLAVIGEVAVQYHGIAPTDPSLEPIWALAEDLWYQSHDSMLRRLL